MMKNRAKFNFDRIHHRAFEKKQQKIEQHANDGRLNGIEKPK